MERFVRAGVVLVIGALVLLTGGRAEAQYIPTLPTTTEAGVLPTVDENPPVGVGGAGAGNGDGSLVTTGSDLTWLARGGAVLVAAGGLVLLSPARRRRRAEAATGRTRSVVIRS